MSEYAPTYYRNTVPRIPVSRYPMSRSTILYGYRNNAYVAQMVGNTSSHTLARPQWTKGPRHAASRVLNIALHLAAPCARVFPASLHCVTRLNTPLRSCQGALMRVQPGHQIDHKSGRGVPCKFLAVVTQ